MPSRSKRKAHKKPVWKGPESADNQGGITQSLLSRFLVCKERFRIKVIEGWTPNPQFSVGLHYGQMWHTCEELLGAQGDWNSALKQYCMYLIRQLPEDRVSINRWYNICKRQFSIYVRYWESHKDVKNRTPILQESEFKVPYQLPSGKVVYLRGKWDGVDLVGRSIYLQENKTKGKIDEDYLTKQLTFDLQTMVYLIALEEYCKFLKEGSEYEYLPKYEKLPGKVLEALATKRIKGIRYNVVRRPLAGGEHSIVQRKGRVVNVKKDSKNVLGKDGKPLKERKGIETNEEFYDRLEDTIEEHPDYFFMRWKVDITKSDIDKFKTQFLNPCLEHLCLWYDHVAEKRTPTVWKTLDMLHYRLPYGIYNPIMEGRGSDVEEYLLSGSTVGLQRVNDLFPEL